MVETLKKRRETMIDQFNEFLTFSLPEDAEETLKIFEDTKLDGLAELINGDRMET